VTGAWWDHVDETVHRLAELVTAHPEEMGKTLRGWSVEDDRWLRRAAILGQLGRRDRVDLGLLADVIEPNRGDPEFFVRKAIGWALREVARWDPDWVRSYVGRNELSPLSRREALKHL
jgi:3-methyladenine DNA glycosylase AlkD